MNYFVTYMHAVRLIIGPSIVHRILLMQMLKFILRRFRECSMYVYVIQFL